MNRQISTGVGIAIVTVLAGAVALGVLWVSKGNIKTTPNIAPPQEKSALPNQPSTGGGNGKQKACLDSGGTVETDTCCQSAGDFPNSCLIGACGCSPASSHQVKTCECGQGKCFDGNSCVSASRFPGNGNSGTGDSQKNGGAQCTMEAKVCPDGTSVGRTGPNCEFAPCPKAQ